MRSARVSIMLGIIGSGALSFSERVACVLLKAMLSIIAMTESEALERAKTKAGGAQGLSKLLGAITPQAISQWKRVPAERVLEVERVTGVSRSFLRPDLYPRSHPAEASV